MIPCTRRPCASAFWTTWRSATRDKEGQVGPEVMRQVEKAVMIQTLDTQWKDHLAAMDYLRQGIHLRGYAQKNPKQEYKREAFEMFSAMLDSIKSEVVGTLARLQLATEGGAVPQPPRQVPEREFEFKHEEFHGLDCPRGARRVPSGWGARARATLCARGPQGRSQRALPLRLGQEIQTLPRQGDLSHPHPAFAPAPSRRVEVARGSRTQLSIEVQGPGGWR